MAYYGIDVREDELMQELKCDSNGTPVKNMISVAEKQPPPTPPAPVPAAPNDSIVTGKLIAIQSLTGNMPWEIIIEAQSSQDVPSYTNATKQRIRL